MYERQGEFFISTSLLRQRRLLLDRKPDGIDLIIECEGVSYHEEATTSKVYGLVVGCYSLGPAPNYPPSKKD